jgi:hypothetical protein
MIGGFSLGAESTAASGYAALQAGMMKPDASPCELHLASRIVLVAASFSTAFRVSGAGCSRPCCQSS